MILGFISSTTQGSKLRLSPHPRHVRFWASHFMLRYRACVIPQPLNIAKRMPDDSVLNEHVLCRMRQMQRRIGRMTMQRWPNFIAGGAYQPLITRCLPRRPIERWPDLARTILCSYRGVLKPTILSLAIAGLIGPPVLAAELSCAHYAVFKKLPSSFQEIASGDLVGGPEIFVLSKGQCTCENGPAISRHSGRPAPLGENWSCRYASGDELEVRQR